MARVNPIRFAESSAINKVLDKCEDYLYNSPTLTEREKSQMTAAAQRIHPEVTRNANQVNKPRAKARKALTKAKQRTLGQFFAAIGASFLPIASYSIAHIEVESNPTMWILVVAALMFSAPMLIQWSQRWCGHVVKAIGFTVLLEGVMVFSTLPALRLSGLAILVLINAHAAWSMAQKYKAVKA